MFLCGVCGGGGGGGDSMSAKERSEQRGDEFLQKRDDKDDDEPIKRRRRRNQQIRKKAKQFLLSPFTNKVNRIPNNNHNSTLPPSTSSSSSSSDAIKTNHHRSSPPGKSINCGSHLFYLRKSKLNLGSSSEDTLTSDPNSPSFSYNLCKSLIEKNDFFSKECNVHCPNSSPPIHPLNPFD